MSLIRHFSELWDVMSENESYGILAAIQQWNELSQLIILHMLFNNFWYEATIFVISSWGYIYWNYRLHYIGEWLCFIITNYAYRLLRETRIYMMRMPAAITIMEWRSNNAKINNSPQGHCRVHYNMSLDNRGDIVAIRPHSNNLYFYTEKWLALHGMLSMQAIVKS